MHAYATMAFMTPICPRSIFRRIGAGEPRRPWSDHCNWVAGRRWRDSFGRASPLLKQKPHSREHGFAASHIQDWGERSLAAWAASGSTADKTLSPSVSFHRLPDGPPPAEKLSSSASIPATIGAG